MLVESLCLRRSRTRHQAMPQGSRLWLRLVSCVDSLLSGRSLAFQWRSIRLRRQAVRKTVAPITKRSGRRGSRSFRRAGGKLAANLDAEEMPSRAGKVRRQRPKIVPPPFANPVRATNPLRYRDRLSFIPDTPLYRWATEERWIQVLRRSSMPSSSRSIVVLANPYRSTKSRRFSERRRPVIHGLTLSTF